MKAITGILYTGEGINGEKVDLRAFNGLLEVSFESSSQTHSLEDCAVEAPMAGCPLVIELPNGQRLECPPNAYDPSFLEAVLPKKSKALKWMEANLGFVFLASLLVIGGLYALIEFGAPLASKKLAKTVPRDWAVKLDAPILSGLDENILKPSKLPQSRQDKLKRKFAKLSNEKVEILFREGGPIGANAFALGGKTIIFTDKIVAKMEDDELLAAIFLHELGHIQERHVLSSLINTLAVNTLAFFVIGDLPGLTESLANFGITLVSLKHSREFEREADLRAAQALKENGLPVEHFTKALEKLKEPANGEKSDFMSTHPGIDARIKLLRRASGQ